MGTASLPRFRQANVPPQAMPQGSESVMFECYVDGEMDEAMASINCLGSTNTGAAVHRWPDTLSVSHRACTLTVAGSLYKCKVISISCYFNLVATCPLLP